MLGIAAYALFLSNLDSHPIRWGGDLRAYYLAGSRVVQDAPLYFGSQLTEPIPADTCDGCFLYPPILAQALAPLSMVALADAQLIWFAVQFVVMYATVWIATSIGGSKPTIERGLWCLVATMWFVPVFASLRFGNVSTILALSVTLVAAGGARAGAGAALGLFLKVTPAALIPASIAMGQRSTITLLASVVCVGLVSFVLSPASWLDYPTVLVNLVRGDGDVWHNHALATIASQLGAPAIVVSAVSLTTIVLGLTAILASVLVARRAGGAPLAALLGTVAMLIIPGTMWYHYLTVLLPLAGMAWAGATPAARIGMFLAAGVVVIGLANPFVAVMGSTILVVLAANALIARMRRSIAALEQDYPPLRIKGSFSA